MVLPTPAAAEMTDAEIDAAYAWPVDTRGAPHWLRANMVSTIDGRGAGPDGLSDLISSPADKRVFGRLRGLADVILIGAGTLRAENYRPARPKPSFADRRAEAGQLPAPVIAVATRSLDLDAHAALFDTRDDGVQRPLILTCAAAPEERRRSLAAVAEIVDCGEDSVDLDRAVAALVARGLRRIHCEGGPSLLHGALAAGVLDELDLTVSPALEGGDGIGIMTGPLLPSAPRSVSLAHVIEDGGTLFLRYLVAELP